MRYPPHCSSQKGGPCDEKTWAGAIKAISFMARALVIALERAAGECSKAI